MSVQKVAAPQQHPISYYSDQYDCLVGPLMSRLISAPNVNRQIIFEFDLDHRRHLTGAEIGDLLLQVRSAIPEITALSADQRAKHWVTLYLPSQRSRFQVKAEMIPTYIEQVYNMVHRNKAKQVRLLIPDDSDIKEEDLVVVSRSDVQGLSPSGRSGKDTLIAEFSSWIRDPGNPEKGKKYVFSLYCIRKALDKKFPSWKKQLLPYLKEAASHSLFAQNAYFVLNALKENATSDDPIRMQYAFILYHLRKALDLIPSSPFVTPEMQQTLQMLLYFCHAKFTEVHMYPFFDDFIPKALQAPQDQPKGLYELPELTFETLAAAVDEANQRLQTVPPEYRQMWIAQLFKKSQNKLGWKFDPNEASNIAYVHSIQMAETGKTCTVLRYGTPTRDPGFFGIAQRLLQNGLGLQVSPHAQIIPEYRAYLAAEPEKITLYINHQQHDQTGTEWITPEKDRARAVQSLEKDFSNFHFLSLPMDEPLWELESVNIDTLKKDLLHSFMGQTNGFAFPKSQEANREELREKVIAILHRVHELYFNKAQLDSVASKQAFIMLFYSEIKDYFKCKLGVDFIVNACVDNKDRGNVSAAVDMAKNLVKLGLENDPVRLRELFILVLAPFIIKNEYILPNRLNVFLNVIHILVGLTQEQRERICKDDITGYHIETQTVPKEETSWSRMVGPTLFIACVENMKQLKEKRLIVEREFETNLALTYFKEESWRLPILKQAIEQDLPRSDIRVNGKRMVDFNTLCQEMGLDPSLFNEPKMDHTLDPTQRDALSFMSMLQQEVAIDGFREASKYLNENRMNLIISQKTLSLSRRGVIDIINRALQDPQTALEMGEKLCAEDPEAVPYLFSAVATRLLPESFKPVLKDLENPAPAYPPVYSVRIDATYKFGVRKLAAYQELALKSPHVGEGPEYAIDVEAHLEKRGPGAVVSWMFV